MKPPPFMIKQFATLAAVIAASLVSNVSADGGALPPLRHVGDISYRNGGIGVDESQALKAEAERYPLTLVFAARIGKRDAYTSAVKVTIVKADGSSTLEVNSEGPYLLVDLPIGNYRITAISNGRSKSQSVAILAGSRRQVVFEWPEENQE
ncbi:hypothetical protein [Nevskia soli]|uniref:hypothetical protein n=1 Tax=Nevskia soli TaxID=418856 RepID=UPI000691CA7E|nr:hypothetical protein [Nevskia soli]